MRPRAAAQGVCSLSVAVTIAVLHIGITTSTARAQAASPAPSVPGAPIDNPAGIPDIRKMFPSATSGEGVSATLQILVLLTVLYVVTRGVRCR